MKETSLTADDNIILEDPNTALELAKSISRTEAEKQEAARLVHETHEHLVTERPTERIKQTGVTIRDTPTVTKKKTLEQSLKLKGMEMLSNAAMLAANTKKAIKASKRDSRSHHQSGGSSEGAGSKPEVLDELKSKTKDTNEGADLKQEVSDVSKAMSSDQESKNESWGDSKDDDDDRKSDDERTETNDGQSIDLNKIDDEEGTQEDEFVHTPDDYVPIDDETQDVDDEEYVHINEELYDDVNVEVEHEEIKQEVASTKVQDDVQEATTVVPSKEKEKNEARPSSSSRSVLSNYVLESETLFAIHLRVSYLEMEVKELRNVDHYTSLLEKSNLKF
ncbi:hypothetical protein Tco_0086950 [Tanacetum coccineum]